MELSVADSDNWLQDDSLLAGSNRSSFDICNVIIIIQTLVSVQVLTFCVLILLAMLAWLLSLARGEVVLLVLVLARELCGPEGDLDLGRVAELPPASDPLGLSHWRAY